MAEEPAPRPAARARDVLAFAAVYFLAGRLGLLFAPPPPFVSAVWPPAGVALAGALHLGRQAWVVIWGVAFLTGTWAPRPPTTTGGGRRGGGRDGDGLDAAGHARRVAAAAVRGTDPSLSRVPAVAALVLGAGVVASLVSATLGVAARTAAGFVSPEAGASVWLTWWLADTAGVVVAAPLLLMLRSASAAPPRPCLEAALLATSVLLVALTGVSGALGLEASRPVFVLLVPLVIWPAFRFPPSPPPP